MTDPQFVPAKRMLRPMNAFTGLIKGQAYLEESPGLVPGYSASGQDVWVPQELSRGLGPGIVLSSVGARCGKTFLADAPVWGTVANTSSWGISPSWDPKFVQYVLNREDFWIKGGSAQPYVQVEPSLSQPVALLSKPRQVEISKFLDRESNQIDALIAKQERLIELLAEKRQAVITHAVTKGLDPFADTKLSGIPWLGDIPAHWTDSRLKFSVKHIEQGVSPQADGVPASSDSWGVLKSGCVNGGVFRESENKQLPSDFIIDSAIVVSVGDLLVSRASGSPKLVGSAARVRSLDSSLILSDKTFRFVPEPDVDADFLEWFLNSQLYRDQVEGSISGAEGLANNISTTALKNIQLPLPPYAEQSGITKDIRRKTDSLARLEGTARKVIDLLRERRVALISAAVNGKVAVSL